MSDANLGCEPMLHQVRLLIDDALPAEQRGPVENHLAACPDCRGAVEFQLGLRQVMRRNVSKATLPEGLSAQLDDIVRREPGADSAPQ